MESLIKEASAFRTKKELGQHLLVDVDTLTLIADSLSARPGDTVIEVGAGIGFLTRLLAQTGADIIAIDLDRQSVSALRQRNYPNVTIKHGDFLGFDLNNLEFFSQRQDNEQSQEQGEKPQPSRLKVIGNVPYQITGRIVGHILGEIDKPSPWLNKIDSIVLTIQHEVAKRFVAAAGQPDYSKASLLINYYCQASILSVVPPAAFHPPPAVTSAVIKLIPRPQPAVQCTDRRLLRKVIEAGFKQRRKMLKNSLSFLRFTPAEIDTVFRQLNFDPQVRAERLSLEQFAHLADALNALTPNHANSSR